MRLRAFNLNAQRSTLKGAKLARQGTVDWAWTMRYRLNLNGCKSAIFCIES